MTNSKASALLRVIAMPEYLDEPKMQKAISMGAEALERIGDLEAQLAEARKDKARLGWLEARCLTIQCRMHSGPEWVVLESSMPIATGDTVQPAMDAARDPFEIGGAQ